MQVKPFFVILPVLVGVVIYAYRAPEQAPDRGTTATPRQYIEQVEKRKEERREQRRSAAVQAPTGQSSR